MEKDKKDKKVLFDPPGDYPEFIDILKRIRKERGRALFILASDGIDYTISNEVNCWRKQIKETASREKFDVLINSPGGDLSQCYVVARLLARCTDNWEALVPDVAASGATLICLGSANIIMSENAQLSPLDPQVISKRREKFFISERQSPLEAFEATRHLRVFSLTSLDLVMRFLLDQRINPRLALETASKFSLSLVEPILNKIEPYDLGAFALDSKVAIEYCKRISNPSNKNKNTQRLVNPKSLVEDYPAHEFVIDLEEAKALNFAVSEPAPVIDELFTDLKPHLASIKTCIGLID